VAGVLAVDAWPAVAGERPAELEVPENLRERWEERTSIMVYDGHVPRAAAERLAWAGRAPQGEAPAGAAGDQRQEEGQDA
jgi:hypothetical protein